MVSRLYMMMKPIDVRSAHLLSIITVYCDWANNALILHIPSHSRFNFPAVCFAADSTKFASTIPCSPKNLAQ